MKRTLIVLLAVGAVLGSKLTLAPTTIAASNSSGAVAIADCRAHGRLTQSYSVAALENALATMPVDVKQYTDCYDVIQSGLQTALKTGHSGSSTSGGSGGSFLPTWLIVVIVLIALGAVTYAALVIRRRRGSDEPPSTSA